MARVWYRSMAHFEVKIQKLITIQLAARSSSEVLSLSRVGAVGIVNTTLARKLGPMTSLNLANARVLTPVLTPDGPTREAPR